MQPPQPGQTASLRSRRGEVHSMSTNLDVPRQCTHPSQEARLRTPRIPCGTCFRLIWEVPGALARSIDSAGHSLLVVHRTCLGPFGFSAGHASMERSTRRFRLKILCPWTLSGRRSAPPDFSIFVSRFWAPKLVPKIVTSMCTLVWRVTIFGTNFCGPKRDTKI